MNKINLKLQFIILSVHLMPINVQKSSPIILKPLKKSLWHNAYDGALISEWRVRWKIRKCNKHSNTHTYTHKNVFCKENRSLNNWKLHFHSPTHLPLESSSMIPSVWENRWIFIVRLIASAQLFSFSEKRNIFLSLFGEDKKERAKKVFLRRKKNF